MYDMKTDLRKKTKTDFVKDFFKLMNNLEKTIENVRKDRDIKLVTTKRGRNYLVSEPNYHTTVFHRKFVSYRNEKNSDTCEQTCLFRIFNTRIK